MSQQFKLVQRLNDFVVGEKVVCLVSVIRPKAIDFPYIFPMRKMCLTIKNICVCEGKASLNFEEIIVNREMTDTDKSISFPIHYFEPYSRLTEEEKAYADLYTFRLN